MIDEQKLLQWIEGKKHVYAPPYDIRDSDKDIAMYKGAEHILNRLQRDIELGEFEEE